MPAPSTAAGQTSTSPAAARTAALGGPRGRRRAPVLGPPAADPDPGNGQGAAGAVPCAGAGAGSGAGATAGPGGGSGAGGGGVAAEQAGDVVRWAVFCCVLVPVVLLAYGSSLGGAAGTALGLVSVTAACRVLLRRSEREMRNEGVRGRRRGQDTP
ncbi:hypothetical protein ACWCQ0_49980 [Streptomyces massasporeus]